MTPQCIDAGLQLTSKGPVNIDRAFFMQRFECVIFDCDGVLVDSEPITNRLIRDSLAAHGLDLTLDQIMTLFVGGTMQGVMEKAIGMGAALPDTWLDDIYAAMFAGLAKEVEAVPGVTAVLDGLEAAGIPFAVGSNGPHAKMAVTLERTGLAQRFAGRIVSREDVAQPKPAPDVYLRAAEICGADPARCAVIEDSATGLRAGQAAGMTCFGFARDSDREKLAQFASAVFEDMAELPRLLGLDGRD